MINRFTTKEYITKVLVEEFGFSAEKVAEVLPGLHKQAVEGNWSRRDLTETIYFQL